MSRCLPGAGPIERQPLPACLLSAGIPPAWCKAGTPSGLPFHVASGRCCRCSRLAPPCQALAECSLAAWLALHRVKARPRRPLHAGHLLCLCAAGCCPSQWCTAKAWRAHTAPPLNDAAAPAGLAALRAVPGCWSCATRFHYLSSATAAESSIACRCSKLQHTAATAAAAPPRAPPPRTPAGAHWPLHAPDQCLCEPSPDDQARPLHAGGPHHGAKDTCGQNGASVRQQLRFVHRYGRILWSQTHTHPRGGRTETPSCAAVCRPLLDPKESCRCRRAFVSIICDQSA